jgi:mRNA-degrading endonuclease RelE of RelBE toxin-antitoxin system
MKAIFIELSSFCARRSDYLRDDEFRKFQNVLMQSPKAGNVIAGTGGLRKIRIADPRRGKGKRGGLRTIYYWQDDEAIILAIHDL